MISIDESSFSGKFVNKKNWVWLSKNKSLTTNYHRGSNFNMIGAISPKNIVGCMLVSGRTNMSTFTLFLELIKQEISHSDYDFYEQVIILIDGAKIH